MVSATTLMYVGLGIGYVIIFIVVGTFLVIRKRRQEEREQMYEPQSEPNLDDDCGPADSGSSGRRVRRRIQNKNDRLRKIAKNLEDTLENPEDDLVRDNDDDDKDDNEEDEEEERSGSEKKDN